MIYTDVTIFFPLWQDVSDFFENKLFVYSGENSKNYPKRTVFMNTIKLSEKVYIVSSAAVVGEDEYKGPLGDEFDFHSVDGDRFGCETWEKAESEMQRLALSKALSKVHLKDSDLSAVFAGDLINQCIGSNYGLLEFDVPFLGLYGACSTAAEGLLLASILCSAYGVKAGAVTSSHNATAERQFRFPLEYGGQRSPTAQWTVTGSGAFVLSGEKMSEDDPYVCEVVPGRAVDAGINDVNNMGAAMAPAAADTLERFFNDGASIPDLIVTGDLGYEGTGILNDLMRARGYDISACHTDCGLLIFDRDGQDKHAGGSGCGCGASVFAANIIPLMRKRKISDVAFIGTGAMMNSMSLQQGQSIPGIAHLVHVRV